MSLAYSTAEFRRAPRESVDYPSRIRGRRLAPTTALIVNISPYGCMVRCDRIMPIGTMLEVDLPGMASRRGTVIWSLGARMGLEFETGISVESYLALLPQMKASFSSPAPT
ncbi:PilZ domain-containing protein [Sphingobium nicotianae]|uniref:PilZ domain-containing protein n=1 Tax=Sphingobium nicotianae TaxID=2782607 RepID=A0A9X1DD22_9SPHN|nr:PilZ domain-containing protein [Sphingobium nicotianae]MBT2187702.1 PilZ domain-containing protein [Sphingobium nicotianae]